MEKSGIQEQREDMNRGLVAFKTNTGIFLSWRMFKREATGSNDTGLTGTDYEIYRNDILIDTVSNSTNYLDKDGTVKDLYSICPIYNSDLKEKMKEFKAYGRCKNTAVCTDGENYIEVKVKQPEGGITPAGEEFTYTINDISVGDVNGDGEYEYILKWYPTNAHDVSHRGYTGRCIIDCYTLTGKLLWRLDMGQNIRSGAHYTQFMVSDFDGDKRAEICVKTAPGTKMTIYSENGEILSEKYITLPKEDISKGISHEDNYVCDAKGYREHLVKMFKGWSDHPEVVNGRWPKTLEECFGIEVKHEYPLSTESAEELADYFLDVYALERSEKNKLREFEGFIFEGPEYLTVFAGDGRELDTIRFPFPRVDDGLMWGDYSMKRIEPCNRVDRFLAGVAYLDGIRPSFIICRGYYTRATLAAYNIVNGKFDCLWKVDSGFVPMDNPFNCNPHIEDGTDPIYKTLTNQGNHSLSTADVDGDGKQEIIYGAACIDQDGSLLYSSYDKLPNGKMAKLGHGDSMHVAKIDPDREGYQIFNVFEGAKEAPYGYALRDAKTGKVFDTFDENGKATGKFGVYAKTDLGRCMIGKIDPDTRGLQVWADNIVYDCKGNRLNIKAPSTNQAIRWAGDLTTQVFDGADYLDTGVRRGVINDPYHGVMLSPKGTLVNNGTKGNPCLVADIFGDFREEVVLRLEDNSGFRIYVNTEITEHKLYTPMDDLMYRSSIAWQSNCYNQTGYTSYYYANDMDFSKVDLDYK
ncbi:MAG: rhamnogalacturonan lyase [Lachnospiraceae bacterium]|nr:rhamnogalacturonan lyase [Lachnospiraceae bacterium]